MARQKIPVSGIAGILLALNLLSCAQDGGGLDGSAAEKDPAAQKAVQAENSSANPQRQSADDEAKAAILAAPKSSSQNPIAVEPASIGGAFLTCNYVDKGIGCILKDSSGVPIANLENTPSVWQYEKDGVRSSPSVSSSELPSGEMLYVVKIPKLAEGVISMSITMDGKEESYSFDLKTLEKEAPAEIELASISLGTQTSSSSSGRPDSRSNSSDDDDISDDEDEDDDSDRRGRGRGRD